MDGYGLRMTRQQEGSARRRTRSELYELIRSRGEVTRSELVALTGMPRSTNARPVILPSPATMKSRVC